MPDQAPDRPPTYEALEAENTALRTRLARVSRELREEVERRERLWNAGKAVNRMEEKAKRESDASPY